MNGQAAARAWWFAAGGTWRIGAAYVAGYLLLATLDRMIQAPLAISFWRPGQALGLALMMTLGPRMIWLVFLTTALGDLLAHGADHLMPNLFSAAAAAGGYALAAKVLREEVGFDSRLSRLRDVLLLVVIVVAAAMAVTALQTAVKATVGALAWDLYTSAAFRAWAADVIGILAVTPALLVHRFALALPRRWLVLLTPEALSVVAIVTIETWLLFGPLVNEAFRAFYLLFLPLIWIGVRYGLPGATLAVVATHMCVHGAIVATGGGAIAVTDTQLLMFALTVTNLVLGAVVSERSGAELWLRAHQAELAHAARLSATGAMASTLAHELNQPLAATTTYIRACQLALRRQSPENEVMELMDKAVAQADRASQVVRGLRAFLRKDDAPRTTAEPRALIAEALALAQPEAARHHVALRAQVEDGLPDVVVDAIQMQQVVLNLVRNAVESMAEARTPRPQVTVLVRRGDDILEVAISDNGPGLPPEVSERLFAPFNTTKAGGMGLGLAIANSIVEAHGGRLWAEAGEPRGSVFRFTMPVSKEAPI